MTESTETPVVSSGEPKKSSKTWLIVVIAVVVACCLCVFAAAAIWYLYTNGDQIFGLTALPRSLGVL